MLDTLMNLVRQHSGEAIVNNPAIPNEQNNEAVQSVTTGILGGLQQQATGGNLGGLLSTVMGQQSTSTQNPVIGGVMNSVTGQLAQRLGISNQVASSIAAAVVPMVLSRLFSKATDPNDPSVDVGNIMSTATGNKEAAGMDWASMAQSAMADGKLDMNDLMRSAGGLMGGGNSGQQSGGGLGGMLGGLFGNK